MSPTYLPEKVDLFINGEFVPARDRRYFRDLNPADDSLLIVAAQAGADDVNAAVLAAQAAWIEHYRETSVQQREQFLLNAADLMQRGKKDIVRELVRESGMPVMRAEDEVEVAVACLRTAAMRSEAISGRVQETDPKGRLQMSIREPLGVVASITPGFTPFLAAVRMSAGALAAGNTVVSLSSDLTPRASAMLAELYAEAGFRPGVYNQLSGFDHEVGEFLATHPMVQTLFYSGSIAGSKLIAELCGQHLKRFSLEFGDKNPALVLSDADLDSAAEAIAMDCFMHGQGNMATSRVICEQKVFGRFTRKLIKCAERICSKNMGSLKDAATWVGLVKSEQQRQVIREQIEDARKKGANIASGGIWIENRCLPTIITGVTPEMRVCRHETPGPVVVLYPVVDFDEGLALANDSEACLTASVWTKDMSKAMEFAQKIDSASLQVNAGLYEFDNQGSARLKRFSQPTWLNPICDIEKLTDTKSVFMQDTKQTAMSRKLAANEY